MKLIPIVLSLRSIIDDGARMNSAPRGMWHIECWMERVEVEDDDDATPCYFKPSSPDRES